MGEITTGGSILLPVAPAAVWRVLVDPAKDPVWRHPWVRSVQPLAPGPVSVGSRSLTETRFLGRDGASLTEITAVEAPRLLAWRGIGGGALTTLDGRYRLEPAASGTTRLTVRSKIATGGVMRLLGPLLAAYLNRRVIPTQLRQLADLLAAESAGG